MVVLLGGRCITAASERETDTGDRAQRLAESNRCNVSINRRCGVM